MLNSKLTLEWAQSFAGRVIRTAGRDVNQQIDTAYRLALSRVPDKVESSIARDFFTRQRAIIAERAAAGEGLALPPSLPDNADRTAAATAGSSVAT